MASAPEGQRGAGANRGAEVEGQRGGGAKGREVQRGRVEREGARGSGKQKCRRSDIILGMWAVLHQFHQLEQLHQHGRRGMRRKQRRRQEEEQQGGEGERSRETQEVHEFKHNLEKFNGSPPHTERISPHTDHLKHCPQSVLA